MNDRAAPDPHAADQALRMQLRALKPSADEANGWVIRCSSNSVNCEARWVRRQKSALQVQRYGSAGTRPGVGLGLS